MTDVEEARLFPWGEKEAVDWVLRPEELTYMYFFDSTEESEIPQLELLSARTRFVKLVAVFTGEETQEGSWSSSPPSFLYWTGPAGLQTTLCLRYGITHPPVLLILDGSKVITRLSPLPSDFSDLPKATYRSLLAGLATGNCPISQEIFTQFTSQDPSLPSLARVLDAISEEIQLDLRGIILAVPPSLHFSYDQFCAILKSHCETQLKKDQYFEIKDLVSNFSHKVVDFTRFLGIGDTKRSLQQALSVAKATVSRQEIDIKAKDELIARLQRELGECRREIEVLKNPPPPPKPKEPELPAPAGPTEEDEYKFWNYGKEDDWDVMQHHPHPQKFEQIAKEKGLWLMTAESTGMVDSMEVDLKLFTKKKKTPYGTPRLDSEYCLVRSKPSSSMQPIKTASSIGSLSQRSGTFRSLKLAGRLVIGKGASG